MNTQLRHYIVLGLMLTGYPALAQTTDARTLLAQSLAAHLGPGGAFPADLVIQGQLTDSSSTRPIRIQVKGKDKFRYDVGMGSGTTIGIVNADAGWAGSPAGLKRVPEHAVRRRPAEVPFLDALTQMDSPQFQSRYRGLEIVGAATLHHVAVHVSDPAPQTRFLRRDLSEDVDLFIDPGTKLIVRSTRMQAADNSMDFRVPVVFDFSDYRQVGALVMPFRIVQTIGTVYSGVYKFTLVIKSVTVNQGISDSTFQAR